jgi:hypothetical protein
LTQRELDEFLKGYHYGPHFWPSIKFPPAKIMIDKAMKRHPEFTREQAILDIYKSIKALGPIQ